MRLRCLPLCLLMLALLLVAGCGGGSDKPADPIALVVALFEEPISTLPKDTSLDGEIESYSGFGGTDVAEAGMFFKGPGLSHDVYLNFYYSDAAAQKEFELAVEDYGTETVPGFKGFSCIWEKDLEEATCLGHHGPIYIEIYSYSDSDSPPDGEAIEAASIEVLKSVAGHFKALGNKASKKVDVVPPRPLMALLRSVPPPPAPNEALFRDPFEVSNDGLLEQFDGAQEVGWKAGDDWRTYISVFNEPQDAQSFLNRYLGSASVIKVKSPETSCTRGGDNQYWVCLSAVEETVVFAEHRNAGSALDSQAVEMAGKLVEHVSSLRAGNLPPEPEDLPRPSATATAVPPTRVPPTPTPTPIVGPSAINAGTWTFTVTVLSNDCPGGNPTPGTNIPLRYQFTEAGTDQMISQDEIFQIEQILPGRRNFGVFKMTLPVLLLRLPVTSGSTNGTGTLSIVFEDVDLGEVHYIEDYGNCRIVADSR